MNRMEEGQRDPSDACHTKASSKKNGIIGRMCTNKPKPSRPWAAGPAGCCWKRDRLAGDAPWSIGTLAWPGTLNKFTTDGPSRMPICRERHPLQNNRRRWPGLGGCGPADRRAGGLVGGGMPAAPSRFARLRAALEGSKDRRMGRQACLAIAHGLCSPWR